MTPLDYPLLAFTSISKSCFSAALFSLITYEDLMSCPRTSFLAVSSPSAFYQCQTATYLPGLPPPGLRCLLSVLYTLKALIRLVPSGLISCRIHPWGLPFRVGLHLQSCTLSPRPIPSCSYRERLFLPYHSTCQTLEFTSDSLLRPY